MKLFGFNRPKPEPKPVAEINDVEIPASVVPAYRPEPKPKPVESVPPVPVSPYPKGFVKPMQLWLLIDPDDGQPILSATEDDECRAFICAFNERDAWREAVAIESNNDFGCIPVRIM